MYTVQESSITFDLNLNDDLIYFACKLYDGYFDPKQHFSSFTSSPTYDR